MFICIPHRLTLFDWPFRFEKKRFQIWTAVSIGFILLATLALVLDTVPEFQTANYLYGVIEDNEILAKIEATCTYWFTFEYLLRLSVSPNKWKFVTAGINVIDLLAIFPYYILAILLTIDPSQGDHPWLIMNDLLRILRVIRILKLARNSNGLQSLGYTLRHSYRELGVVALFLSMFVVIFSSLVYFAEKNDDNSNFESIPVAFWWAIITMTSVGYGDMVPTTTVGKLIGTVCCICGVMIVALPIPIIVNTFTEFYKDKTRREKVQKRREAVNRAKRCALPSHVDYVVVEKALPRWTAVFAQICNESFIVEELRWEFEMAADSKVASSISYKTVTTRCEIRERFIQLNRSVGLHAVINHLSYLRNISFAK